jgi:hypothetical protein
MKTILFSLMLIISFGLQAQPYLSTGVLSKGVAAHLGILAGKIDISAGVKFPLMSVENPTVLDLTVGRQILLTNHDADNYTATPAIGIASSKYNTFDYRMKQTLHTDTKAIYSLEIGKDAYLGRFYLKAWHCGNNYIEIGMRYFVSR